MATKRGNQIRNQKLKISGIELIKLLITHVRQIRENAAVTINEHYSKFCKCFMERFMHTLSFLR